MGHGNTLNPYAEPFIPACEAVEEQPILGTINDNVGAVTKQYEQTSAMQSEYAHNKRSGSASCEISITNIRFRNVHVFIFNFTYRSNIFCAVCFSLLFCIKKNNILSFDE